MYVSTRLRLHYTEVFQIYAVIQTTADTFMLFFADLSSLHVWYRIRLATSRAQSGRKRNRVRSVRPSLEVRAKRSTRGEHDLFRLQEIESSDVTLARSFLLLSA